MYLMTTNSFFEIPNFVLISVIGMLILSILFGLVLNKFLVAPIITFLVLGVLAFILPNFFRPLSYEPLLGYAIFLAVIALLLDILYFFLSKDRRQKKKLKRREDKERSRYNDTQNRTEMEAIKKNESKFRS